MDLSLLVVLLVDVLCLYFSSSRRHDTKTPGESTSEIICLATDYTESTSEIMLSFCYVCYVIFVLPDIIIDTDYTFYIDNDRVSVQNNKYLIRNHRQ